MEEFRVFILYFGGFHRKGTTSKAIEILVTSAENVVVLWNSDEGNKQRSPSCRTKLFDFEC